MQQYTNIGQPIPNDVPFEEYFAYLSRLVSVPFKNKPVSQLTEEELHLLKNHEARLTAIFNLECKPRNEWTPRDHKMLATVISGSNMVTVHDGFYELVEF